MGVCVAEGDTLSVTGGAGGQSYYKVGMGSLKKDTSLLCKGTSMAIWIDLVSSD